MAILIVVAIAKENLENVPDVAHTTLM